MFYKMYVVVKIFNLITIFFFPFTRGGKSGYKNYSNVLPWTDMNPEMEKRGPDFKAPQQR